jgi:hypothetical protein
MTPPDAARAAVAAWMEEPCPHKGHPDFSKSLCPDCLLALAAAQRAEEREAIDAIVAEWEAAYPEDVFPPYTTGLVTPDRTAAQMARHVTREIRKQLRARREGPGGAQ